MKLLWRFGLPTSPLGYGITTRQLVPRLTKLGHDILVAAFEYNGPPMIVENMKVWGSSQASLVEFIFDEFKFDYIVSAPNYITDKRVLKNSISCAALDFEVISKDFAKILKNSKYTFAVSKHNQKELNRVGIEAEYVPWGVDTTYFHKDVAIRESFRKKYSWNDDSFVIGCVATNLIDDRKNLINLLKAFQIFAQSHYNAILYLHTGIYGAKPLNEIINNCGFSDRIFFPDQKYIYMNAVPMDHLLGVYNAFDVFCLPTKGESYCLPLLEAQACGCPAIVTDTTACPEHLSGGWLIPVDDEDLMLTDYKTWNVEVRPHKIVEQLELAYSAWENNKLFELSQKAREGTLVHGIDVVFEKYWKPFMKHIEDTRK